MQKYIELFGGGDKPQWSVLKHNGPMFPSIYIPHKTEILVKGKETILNSEFSIKLFCFANQTFEGTLLKGCP